MSKAEIDEPPPKAPTRGLSVVDRWIIALVSGLIGVPFIIDYYYRGGANGNPGIQVAGYLFFLLIYVYPTVIALRSSGLHGFLKYFFGLSAVPLFIAIFIACVHLLFSEIPALGQYFSRAQASANLQLEKAIALIAVAPAAIIFWLWYKVLAVIDRAAGLAGFNTQIDNTAPQAVKPAGIADSRSHMTGTLVFLRWVFRLFFVTTSFLILAVLILLSVHLWEQWFPGIAASTQASAARGKSGMGPVMLIAVPLPLLIFYFWHRFFKRIDQKFDARLSGQSSKHALGWSVAIAVVVAAAIAAFYAYRPGPHSQWMASAQYQRDFDTRAPKGFYPQEVEGRCEAGGEKYLPDWRRLPQGAAFFHYFGMTRESYDDKNREYLAQGFSLVSAKHFKDCSGVERYQATWLRR